MKSGEEPAEKEEFLGEKLRRVVKRGGQTTPTAPFWRTSTSCEQHTTPFHNHTRSNGVADHQQQEQVVAQDFAQRDNLSSISVRKLGATLWELHQYTLPLATMHNGAPPLHLRRLHHRQRYADHDPSPIAPELPGSSSSLRRHVASLMQRHRSTDLNNYAMQPVSPASYSSSMEITPYNPVGTPSSSIEPKGRTGETSFSLKTSTELLRVLNRIWGLEEQHVSNVALVKALKKDLEHARSRVKELMRSQHADRRQMDEMMKLITDDKLVRKNKEQDRISSAIDSMRAELEDERKLRKRSESLHRKLARELYDVKTSLASVSKKLDEERKSRSLLEDLCNEFAWGVRDYEMELHALRQKSEKDWAERTNCDNLILHVSESWLDECMQAGNAAGEAKSALEKLRPEIEAFLHAKRNHNSKLDASQVTKDLSYRRSSLESIPLNMVVSAPKDDGDDDDNESLGSDSNCFELEKVIESNLKTQCEEKWRQKQVKKKLAFSERATGQASGLQGKFEEQMAQAMSHGELANRVEVVEHIMNGKGSPLESNISQNPERREEAKESNSERKNEPDAITASSSNHILDNLIRNHYLLTEGGQVQQDKEYGMASSAWRSHPSPVRKWTEKLPSHDLDISESSSKLPPDLKQNTLKTKLLEARTRGQRSRSRPKASLTTSRNE